MIIGVTLENEKGLDGNVCAHFGQCANFLIAEMDNGKITSSKVVPNNAVHGGGGCLAVDEILKHNITHVISGGMGMGAQQKFADKGIPIHGFIGKVNDALESFTKNMLGGIAPCTDHGDHH